jgi:hypothetical protein
MYARILENVIKGAHSNICTVIVAAIMFLMANRADAAGNLVFIRANQLGYDVDASKIAIAFSQGTLPETFEVMDDKHQPVYHEKCSVIAANAWGAFHSFAELDFTSLKTQGQFVLKVGDAESLRINISAAPDAGIADELLEFMREQQCGYNPWLEIRCHQLDGRTAYGPREHRSMSPAAW